MLFSLEEHPPHRANWLLARAVGGTGIEALPPNLQRMDLVAGIFSSNIHNQTEASAAFTAPAPSTASDLPAHTPPQDAPQPRTVFWVPSAACRDFDPFITADLGEWMVRIRLVLSLLLGHPNCTDEDRKNIDDLWRYDVCHEVVIQTVLFIRQPENQELLYAAWEADRPYLGPDTKAGRARMRKEQATMAPGLADDSSGKPDNPPRESNEACSSSSSSSSPSSSATTATAPEDHRLRQHQLEQDPTPPGSFSPGHKEECVEATRAALGALSLSEQNRRSNKTPTPERVRQDRHEDEGYKLYVSDMGYVAPEGDNEDDGALSLSDRDGRSRAPTPESRHQNQHEDEGYKHMSDMGYVSPEDDEGDNDDDDDDYHYEQGQDQLQHRDPFEYQEEERRLSDQLPQVGDRLLHDFRRQVPYHQQHQQQQQQHLDPSGHQETQTIRRMELVNMAGETPTSRWGHIDPSSEEGQMKWVEVIYPFFRREVVEEAESSTQSPSHPDLGQNITDADSHGSDGDPTIEEYTWCPHKEPGFDRWYPPCEHPNHQRQTATGSEAASAAEAHDDFRNCVKPPCPHSYHSGCHISF